MRSRQPGTAPKEKTDTNKLESGPAALPPNGKKLSGQGRAKLTLQKEAISDSINMRFFVAVPKAQPLTESISNLVRKMMIGTSLLNHAKRALVVLLIAFAHMPEFAVCPTSPLCEALPNVFLY